MFVTLLLEGYVAKLIDSNSVVLVLSTVKVVNSLQATFFILT
jgi:hypothetical protein